MVTAFDTTTNHILTAATVGYTYDAAGNVMSDGTYTYTYDAEGNMTGVSGGASASYVYDALNHRVETITSSGTQQFVFHPNGSRAAILNSSGAAVSEQTYFNGTPIAFYKGGAFHYQHQDWLGTERMRTSATATVDGTFTSLPFGDALTTASGSDDDPSHYTGSDQDAETNTVHAMFRQYASRTGTWFSPDPYSGSYDPLNPESMNRYVYVLDNPLAYSDPSGLDGCVQYGWDTLYDENTTHLTPHMVCTGSYDRGGAGSAALGGTAKVGGFGGGGTSNHWTVQTQSCLSEFNNTYLGKAVNFLSLASPFIGPNPGESMIDTMKEGYAKVTVLSLLKGAGHFAESLEETPWLNLAYIGGELFEAAAEEIGAPVVAVATISQIGVHLACKYVPRT